MRLRAFLGFSLLLGATATVGCFHQHSAVMTALNGDLKSLKTAIAEGQKNGTLDNSATSELAWAVAGREVRSARGSDAAEQVSRVRQCASALVPVLEDKSSRLDEAGAEAAMILLELGKLKSDDTAERYAGAEAGSWRALAARAAVSPRWGTLRRDSIHDPDERVRRGALQAALLTGDTRDLDELLEAARLDPDPLSRSLATRAVGSIGSERAVLALVDYWAKADEAERMTIIDAWSAPNALKFGGGRELTKVTETENGLPVVAAAAALVRTKVAPELGNKVLERFVREGSTDERRLSIRMASVDPPELASAIAKAGEDPDPEVSVMAWARLVAHSKYGATARKKLLELAKGKSAQAPEARAALAVVQESSIVPQLKTQLAARDAHQRRVAAFALVRLGRLSDAAIALADDRPDVRLDVACSMLAERDSTRTR